MLSSKNEREFEEYNPNFRHDVQALRALAVTLVVLYHANMPGIHGGFLGVDVFFVVSGFVITGVLLQERAASHKTSIADFYARRIRRILPIASIVLIGTLFAAYHWLGYILGGQNANDAKWVGGFVSNLHFARDGTQYFAAQQSPSAFQQYWSLSVEEQFYLVWPLTFFALTSFLPKLGARTKLMTALVAIIVASLIWSVVETSHNPVWAFYSPLTRAWELALGAALAVATPWLRDRAPRFGMSLGVTGLISILLSTWSYDNATSWPGSAVIIPVLATGAIIAGGTLRESSGSGRIVRLPPIQWTGNISYSLYLVHWPILIIATEHAFNPLSRQARIELVILSFAVAALSYRLVETPFRKARVLVNSRGLTYGLGATFIALSYAAIYWHLYRY